MSFDPNQMDPVVIEPGKLLFPEGSHDISARAMTGQYTTCSISVDRPTLGVTLGLSMDVSLDGGLSWVSAGKITTDSTLPANWPGKAQGAPLPKPGIGVQFLDANGEPVVLNNPVIKGSLTVTGGTLTAATEIKAA